MDTVLDIAARLAARSRQATIPDIPDIPGTPQRKPRQVERAKLADLDTGHPLMRQAVDMVRRWKTRKEAGHTDASLVLAGPVGTGKTHIARAVLWSIAYNTDDGKPVAPAGRFYHATDLLMAMNPTRGQSGVTEVPRPSTFIGAAPILVIDDVGTEQRIPFIAADVYEDEIHARYFRVLDYCYQFSISVVVTTNLSIPQLSERIGRRAWDRLSEMAPKGYMIDLSGVPSWRQQASGR